MSMIRQLSDRSKFVTFRNRLSEYSMRKTRIHQEYGLRKLVHLKCQIRIQLARTGSLLRVKGIGPFEIQRARTISRRSFPKPQLPCAWNFFANRSAEGKKRIMIIITGAVFDPRINLRVVSSN